MSDCSLPASLPPRLLSREQAAEYLGVSPNHFIDEVAKAIPPVHIGRRNLWDRRALDRWVDEQSGFSGGGIGKGSMLSVEEWVKKIDEAEDARRARLRKGRIVNG